MQVMKVHFRGLVAFYLLRPPGFDAFFFQEGIPFEGGEGGLKAQKRQIFRRVLSSVMRSLS